MFKSCNKDHDSYINLKFHTSLYTFMGAHFIYTNHMRTLYFVNNILKNLTKLETVNLIP